MDIVTAIILGIVQGLTEFLPVSSSGHLVLAESLIGNLPSEQDAAAVNVLVHLGSLLAILLVLRRDIVALVWPRIDWRVALLLIYVSIPAAIAGLSIKYALPDDVEHTLLGSPWVACAGLLVTSIILYISERPREERVDLTTVRGGEWWRAGLVGLAQAVAILPGVSRSGSTICSALLLGWRRPAAVTLSFLMGSVAISGAGILEARTISELDPASALAAFGASLVFSLLGLKLVQMVVIGRRLRWFSLYTGIVGLGGLIAFALLG
ncbi:MAG: undecaprenyl-diphosphate phosphatase [Planctomycetaceae bacterium]|nr:undecaprenyl-diphosphate phosphatase [Planctomycetaceae bacterium]